MESAAVFQVEELPLFQREDGGAIPTSPLQLSFKAINYQTAKNVVVKYHYLHRRPPISWSFGAYFDESLLGVCTVGKPASHTMIKGVAGLEQAKFVFELNRLWMDDICPKNSESRFLSWVIRQLPPTTILVSYADTKYGYFGKIYQATNWIYTGTSVPFKDYTKNGKDHRSIPKNERIKEQMDMVERSIKHRYVFFCDPSQRHFLKWPIKPYPKELTIVS